MARGDSPAPDTKSLFAKIGEGVTKARAALDKVDELHVVLPQAAAMAAAKKAAEIVRTNGGTRQNFVDMMMAAWDTP